MCSACVCVCVCDRRVFNVTPSVRHALVKDLRSVLHAFTLSKTAVVLPSVHLTTTLMHSMAPATQQAGACAAIIAV